MDTKALVIPTEGEPRIVTKAAGEQWLTLFYREIGCSTVDAFDVTPDIDAWCDDEALFVAEPQRNTVAQQVIAQLARCEVDVIHGTFVLTGGTGPGGATLGLDDETACMLRTLAMRIRGAR